ncbi:MAG TPA: hypothetical protein VFW29_08405 [Solirubrobacteraceae bacterium]|nr:hypothetical protein [Solirubrobacteraceae bacterium]
MSPRALRTFLALAAAAALLAVAGCGSSADAPPGLVISGPGLQTSQPARGVNQPPWRPEYAHLAVRLKEIGIPPGGQEKFHIHVMVRIYINGLLAPLPADIGLDKAHGVESSMHTHDGSGIVHMEAPHPFRYTLGDFFAVWGVELGPEQVGGLKGLGGDHLHFYLNGKPLSNPAALVLHRYDNIVIGYGADKSFPHDPSIFLLRQIEKGEGNLGCGKAKKGQHTNNCLAPTQPAGKPSAKSSA